MLWMLLVACRNDKETLETADTGPSCEVSSSFWPDRDGDGFGAGDPVEACEAPADHVDNDDDCDDLDPAVNPDAVETCNGWDDDCDGHTDEDLGSDYWPDEDGDGHGAGEPVQACAPPSGTVTNDDDCDDGDPAVNPSAHEVCNGVDDDCDGDADGDALDASDWYADADGDGYGDPGAASRACEQPSGTVANDEDCDDGDTSLSPETRWYADSDGDGWGSSVSVASCLELTGFVSVGGDCDDGDGAVNPDGVEACNGVDDDCDGYADDEDPDDTPTGQGTWYADGDSDGFGDPSSTWDACEAPSGYVADDTDCDDTSGDSYPGASELCDGEDNDCDGTADAGLLGSGSACAASSCLEILEDGSSNGDGDYVLDPDGSGAATWTCDMSTDGGGWTRVLDWDRESDGDTLTDFEALFTEDANNMGEWTSGSTYIQWSDYDATSDVMAYHADIAVENDGELLYEVDYYGYSMEDSGVFFFVEHGSGYENLLCRDGSSASYHSASEYAWVPYSCSQGSNTSWSWSGTTQDDVGAEVTAFHVRSLHHDATHGDYSRLYRVEVWVR